MSYGIQCLTINESSVLIKTIDDTHNLAIVTLFLNIGLLLAELIDIKTSSIDWDKKIFPISGHYRRKNPKCLTP